jgi:mono/diheme cytochrome c family protein
MSGKFFGGFVVAGALLVWSSGWAQKPDAVGSPVDGSGKGRLIDSIQGPALYKAYCASCHGADAKGNGPMTEFLRVSPSDLTRISVHYEGTFPLTRIERIISGEDQLHGHGTREMPVWGPIFSQIDQDRDLGRVRIDNLARYLREIQGK